MKNLEKWENEINISRQHKNDFFGSGHPQSPIAISELSQFKGLEYFPPNINYRFDLKLHDHEDKLNIKIGDTKGNVRNLIRWGEFHCKINNKDCIIQAYKNDPEEQRLFIPYRDKTSGKETYGAGRYLDLDIEKQNKDEKWILDFNVGYNPWCAYSENYACPFVPPENWLDVEIKAGEKKFLHNK